MKIHPKIPPTSRRRLNRFEIWQATPEVEKATQPEATRSTNGVQRPFFESRLRSK